MSLCLLGPATLDTMKWTGRDTFIALGRLVVAVIIILIIMWVGHSSAGTTEWEQPDVHQVWETE